MTFILEIQVNVDMGKMKFIITAFMKCHINFQTFRFFVCEKISRHLLVTFIKCHIEICDTLVNVSKSYY